MSLERAWSRGIVDRTKEYPLMVLKFQEINALVLFQSFYVKP